MTPDTKAEATKSQTTEDAKMEEQTSPEDSRNLGTRDHEENGIVEAHRAHRRPLVDIYEGDGSWLLLADVPGASTHGLELTIEGRKLSLLARTETGGPGRTPLFPFDWKRSFTVPEGVELESISARLDMGVLRVELPRQAAAAPRSIDVLKG